MSDVETSERDGLTPDELCDEISQDFENVEITADETEFLLQEALSLNKRLKAELRRHSHGGGSGPASPLDSSLDGSPLAARPPRHGGKGARTMLPPINHSKQGASSKSKRSPPKGKKLPSDRVSQSAGSVKRQPSASKGKPSRTSRSADNRPEWNDRFSF